MLKSVELFSLFSYKFLSHKNNSGPANILSYKKPCGLVDSPSKKLQSEVETASGAIRQWMFQQVSHSSKINHFKRVVSKPWLGPCSGSRLDVGDTVQDPHLFKIKKGADMNPCFGPNFIELPNQKVLLNNCLLSRNEDTSHKLYIDMVVCLVALFW